MKQTMHASKFHPEGGKGVVVIYNERNKSIYNIVGDDSVERGNKNIF